MGERDNYLVEAIMAAKVLVVEVVKCVAAGSAFAVALVEVKVSHGHGGGCGVADCCVGPGVNLCSGGERVQRRRLRSRGSPNGLRIQRQGGGSQQGKGFVAKTLGYFRQLCR
jgi:hypothetical protein